MFLFFHVHLKHLRNKRNILWREWKNWNVSWISLDSWDVAKLSDLHSSTSCTLELNLFIYSLIDIIFEGRL